jgi:protein SCO1/2
MIDQRRRQLLAAAALGPAALALAAPRQGRAVGYGAGYFPNVVLRTQEDKEVRFYEELLKGKLVVIQFTYASCNALCPLITANLVRVQRLLGDRVGRDIFMYSLTLEPERDSPAVLRQRMQELQVGPGWTFLTGRRADMELLRRKFGFVDPDPVIDADTAQHTGMIRIGNEPYERWSGCAGQARAEWIVKTILWLQGPVAQAA